MNFEKDIRDNNWPTVRREDLCVSDDIANLVKGFELPNNVEYDDLKLEYLIKKHG
ncbi:MAG: hypothetical protein J6T70_19620 [Bacteroidales bacterium]|nr:hypothetical protein [Bacteroidales bacterium]